jgi:hypothetical protein
MEPLRRFFTFPRVSWELQAMRLKAGLVKVVWARPTRSK